MEHPLLTYKIISVNTKSFVPEFSWNRKRTQRCVSQLLSTSEYTCDPLFIQTISHVTYILGFFIVFRMETYKHPLRYSYVVGICAIRWSWKVKSMVHTYINNGLVHKKNAIVKIRTHLMKKNGVTKIVSTRLLWYAEPFVRKPQDALKSRNTHDWINQLWENPY